MQLLGVHGGIEYGRFELVDLDPMSDVLASSFSGGEPMALAVGLSHRDIQDIVRLFSPKAAAEGLTIVARAPSGTLIGALLSQDFATPAPPGLENAAQAFLPIGALLEGLDDAYRKNRAIEPGTHLHLFMIGVLQSYAGKKVAQQLLETSLQSAIGMGYRHAVTEATGNLSQHIFQKAGFVDRHVAKYADFEFEKQRVFRSITSPAGTVLMDKKLA